MHLFPHWLRQETGCHTQSKSYFFDLPLLLLCCIQWYQVVLNQGPVSVYRCHFIEAILGISIMWKQCHDCLTIIMGIPIALKVCLYVITFPCIHVSCLWYIDAFNLTAPRFPHLNARHSSYSRSLAISWSNLHKWCQKYCPACKWHGKGLVNGSNLSHKLKKVATIF